MKKNFGKELGKAGARAAGAGIAATVSRRFLRNTLKNPMIEGAALLVAGVAGASATKNEYVDAMCEGIATVGALRILNNFMPDAGLAGAEEFLLSQGSPQLAGVSSNPNLFADLAGNFDEIGYVEEPINGMEDIAGVFDELGNLYDANGNFLGNLDELGNLDDLGTVDEFGMVDDLGDIGDDDDDDLGDIGDDDDDFDDDDE